MISFSGVLGLIMKKETQVLGGSNMIHTASYFPFTTTFWDRVDVVLLLPMGEVKAGLNHWTTEVLTCAWNGNRFHTYDDCISESAELGGPATIPRQCSNKSYRDRGTGHTDCQLPLTDVALPNTLSECYTTKRTIAKSFLFENGNEAWVSVKFVSHWTNAKFFFTKFLCCST